MNKFNCFIFSHTRSRPTLIIIIYLQSSILLHQSSNKSWELFSLLWLLRFYIGLDELKNSHPLFILFDVSSKFDILFVCWFELLEAFKLILEKFFSCLSGHNNDNIATAPVFHQSFYQENFSQRERGIDKWKACWPRWFQSIIKPFAIPFRLERTDVVLTFYQDCLLYTSPSPRD